ncbi:hypothetical protein [Actinokineospora sp. HUAS TT18]|uniref:hypothetical protein n=1 Tax=Actinokineospora sp. HUAS TT18 TaxID=3447451 RepID=UPI003F5248D7
MRTSTNLAIQVTALVTFVALRFVGMGYGALVFVMTVVGPLLAVTPTVLAARVLGRGRLARRAAVPFMVAAGALVVAGACVADERGFAREPIPIVNLLTGDGVRKQDPLWALDVVGWLAVAVFVAALVWTVVALRTEVPRWARWVAAVAAVVAVAGAVVVEVQRRDALPDAADVAATKARSEALARDVRTALRGERAAGRWLPCAGRTGAYFEVTGDSGLTPGDARAALSPGWRHHMDYAGSWSADRDEHRLIVDDRGFTLTWQNCLSLSDEDITALAAEAPQPIR